MNRKPIILVVDDDESVVRMILDQFKKSKLALFYEIFFAKRSTTAHSLFELYFKFIAALCLDACLNPDDPGRIHTIPLISTAQIMDYTEPMITMSGEKFFRERMLKVGCTHSVDRKDQLIALLEILLLPKAQGN